MKTKIILLAIVTAVILITAGCVGKKTNDTKSNITINGSDLIDEAFGHPLNYAPNITATPKMTATPVKALSKNTHNYSVVQVYDFKEKQYPVVLLCLQNVNKSWGNSSLGNVNDNANDPTHIFQPSSSQVIKFDDNIHMFYIEDIGITLPHNKAVIIEVRQNCEKELIESVQ